MTPTFILSAVVALFLLNAAKESAAEPTSSEAGDTRNDAYCLTGAFLSDNPGEQDIKNFQKDYGKKPFLVMMFLDWGGAINREAVRDIYAENCVPLITWEPWNAADRKGADYSGLIAGGYDEYISDFAEQVKTMNGPVFIRFAHEMNGDWYPWSGTEIGAEKYVAMYRHVKDIFDDMGADNAKWVFSVNCEDVPSGANNSFMRYYPGDEYVDYVGIDGYNWGDTQPWSRWRKFKNIFAESYKEITDKTEKPVMISEFSSAASGGDKTLWIKEAMIDIKKWNRIKAFVLFNVSKEAEWSFPAGRGPAKEFRLQLKDPYFRDSSSLENL
jgi:beta-mannanase